MSREVATLGGEHTPVGVREADKAESTAPAVALVLRIMYIMTNSAQHEARDWGIILGIVRPWPRRHKAGRFYSYSGQDVPW
jgi:hypothetical protein